MLQKPGGQRWLAKWEGRVSRAEVIVNAQPVPLGMKYFEKGKTGETQVRFPNPLYEVTFKSGGESDSWETPTTVLDRKGRYPLAVEKPCWDYENTKFIKKILKISVQSMRYPNLHNLIQQS